MRKGDCYILLPGLPIFVPSNVGRARCSGQVCTLALSCSDWLFQAQIHLVGNLVNCSLANLSLGVYIVLLLSYLLRRRRRIEDIPAGTCFFILGFFG